MRTIPIKLAEHYASRRTSLARLFKLRCRDGSFLTFTTADHDITYSDGPDGDLFYPAIRPGSLSAFDWSSSLSVDNAMLSGFVNGSGLTEQKIKTGILSHARFWIYEVNYLDLTQGHAIIGSGSTGETTYNATGFKVELRSKTQQLKQPISETYTLTCTVKYGSAACGKTFEWFDASVDSVDAIEPDRVFSVIGDSDWPGDDRFALGVMRVLTGDNAGAEVDVETQDGGDFELLLPLPYPLATTDQLQFRIDCNKEARDDVGGCKSSLRWGADWPLHHRGFPDIPVADKGSLLVPGAQT